MKNSDKTYYAFFGAYFLNLIGGTKSIETNRNFDVTMNNEDNRSRLLRLAAWSNFHVAYFFFRGGLDNYFIQREDEFKDRYLTSNLTDDFITFEPVFNILKKAKGTNKEIIDITIKYLLNEYKIIQNIYKDKNSQKYQQI